MMLLYDRLALNIRTNPILSQPLPPDQCLSAYLLACRPVCQLICPSVFLQRVYVMCVSNQINKATTKRKANNKVSKQCTYLHMYQT